uniref:NADH:quinone oxidoreductase/Mrp antiporter transmembrane domain-containing protein n=1 Tax=Solanum lycopersicum TaxID=4081 RepID=K4CJY8_SOLLC
MKADFFWILPHVRSFLAVSPEIFIINATFIFLIYGFVFSTSNKCEYPLLVSKVGCLGLLSVACLGGKRALGYGGATIVLLHNLKQHRVWTTENRSMGGHLILLGTFHVWFVPGFLEIFDDFESIVIIPLPTCGMLFMISTYDSIGMYLAIEPQSLCFYVIAASKRKSRFPTEVGLKYFIIAGFPFEILLFGYD